MKRIVGLGVFLCVISGLHPATAGALVAEPVLTGPESQILPAADDTHLAWTQFTKRRPAFARIRNIGSAGPGIKVNDSDRGASFTGGFNDGNFIYQQVRPSGSRFRSDVRVYDPDTGDYRPPPQGVNTDRWEWAPSWTDTHVLFGRNHFARPTSPWRVMLLDRATGDAVTLDQAPGKCGCIRPGNLTDQYATWTKCRQLCRTYVYDIGTQDQFTVPHQQGKHEYYGSVTADDVVYFARSGNACGRSVRIFRWTIGDPSVVLVHALPAHLDVAYRLGSVVKLDTHTDVYFDRFDCRRRFRPDIFVVRDADTAVTVAGRPDGGARAHAGGKRLPMFGSAPDTLGGRAGR